MKRKKLTIAESDELEKFIRKVLKKRISDHSLGRKVIAKRSSLLTKPRKRRR